MNMDKGRIIEHLCSRGHRGSTTDHERWAANEIHQWFQTFGLKTEIQNFKGHKSYGGKLAIHLTGAIAAALLPLWNVQFAIISSIILVSLIASFFLEATYFIDIVSKVFRKGNSSNVLGMIQNNDAARRILFVAHYDSQKEGMIFGPKFIGFMKRFASPTSTITPIHLTLLSIVGLLFTSMLFSFDLSGNMFSIHLIIHGLLIFWGLCSLVLMMQWALNPRYVPGANDNASGVAVMLSLAEVYSKEVRDGIHSDVEFSFLATGCEETGLGGALSFLSDNKEWLSQKETIVICMDGFGYGKIHCFTADGMLKTRPYDRELIRVARELSQEMFGEERSFICRVFTDGLAFSLNRFRTITFGSLDDEKIISNYHWRTDTPENVDYKAVDEAQGFIEAFVDRIIHQV